MLKRQLSLLNPALRWFLLAMILANISSEMAYILLPVYLRELGATVAQVGLVFSVMSLVLLVLQLFGGLLSDALGRLRTIAPGSVAAATGYLLLPLSPSWPWVMLVLSLEVISGAMVGPSFGPFIAEQSTEENRGRVFGIAYSLFMVVGVIGPALGGSLTGRLGFRAMLWVAAAMCACAAWPRPPCRRPLDSCICLHPGWAHNCGNAGARGLPLLPAQQPSWSLRCRRDSG
jgi:MFS family permease